MNTRTVLGLLIGLGGLGGAAVVGVRLLGASAVTAAAPTTSNRTASGQIEGHETGDTVQVGVSSGWATPELKDAGVVDTSYLPSGWAYFPVGVSK